MHYTRPTPSTPTMAEVGGKVPQLGYLRAFPTILVLLHLCFTVVSATGVPKRVEDTWNAICAPFRNFIRPHDLPESVDLKPRQVLTKQRLLFTFACVEVFTWIGRTVFDFYLEDWSWSSICGVYALSWVSSSRMTLCLSITLCRIGLHCYFCLKEPQLDAAILVLRFLRLSRLPRTV